MRKLVCILGSLPLFKGTKAANVRPAGHEPLPTDHQTGRRLVRHFRWSLTSREMYRWAQLQHVETLTDIQHAARLYYLQKLTFGGKVDGQTLGVGPASTMRINLLRLEQDLSDAQPRRQPAANTPPISNGEGP